MAVLVAAAQPASATRQQHALERYKSETLSVFSISPSRCDGTRFAMVSDPDNYLHHVEEGEYLGDAFGRVSKITAEAVIFVELRQKDGKWVEVEKSLRLPESKIDAEADTAHAAAGPNRSGCR
ncbi:MAG TPA: pilus assembly protein PilP [Tahibacter sp.]|nr:pilus assembly protein PilP [Tahibacter sp.]